MAKKYDAYFYEASAQSNENIQKVFETLAEAIAHKKLQKSEKLVSEDGVKLPNGNGDNNKKKCC